MEEEGGMVSRLHGKVLANVFYEPSTRTSCSFAAAMMRLDGRVLSVDAKTSSVKKGETLEDTMRSLACYADGIVLRHPDMGAAERAAAAVPVPVFNAGDGVGEHPTQALLDVYTIRRELGRVDDLSVALVGDLRHGRTVHSLARLLSLFSGVRLMLVSPATLTMPVEVVEAVAAREVRVSAHKALEEVIAEADVVYVTRVQRERFADPAAFQAVRGSYIVDTAVMAKAKAEAVLMHPLPRVDEIAVEVDGDPRAAYFRQMRHGMILRMALLDAVLGRPTKRQ